MINGGSNLFLVHLGFTPGSMVEIKSDNNPGPVFPYTRSLSGAVIRFPSNLMSQFFGIIISGTEMKGIYKNGATNTNYLWLTTKQ